MTISSAAGMKLRAYAGGITITMIGTEIIYENRMRKLSIRRLEKGFRQGPWQKEGEAGKTLSHCWMFEALSSPPRSTGGLESYRVSLNHE